MVYKYFNTAVYKKKKRLLERNACIPYGEMVLTLKGRVSMELIFKLKKGPVY